MWKPYVYLVAVDLLALSGLAPAAAQDRTSIAFSDPSRPGTVKVALLNGGITVRGYAGKEVVVEARPHGERRKPAPARADGLRRLEDPSTGLNIEEQD
ncbi:MAG TPA: hypothetical protein VG672_11935, partial [Bryobacteraceae bacterium]|nr:hypothetical protein [Bryobacteraceae bacterium]